ncbi:prolyl oligopeptidase family serine peptidase [Massilia dura]|uniref:Prolyl oligopeptidase family serine peptidase n=1 Tax=Pseudoduganella dura TaxID=321982 RepID=A0A6I3XI22_9BURK|nr:lipase family protein [Pseudoduganella dura]MUI14043.1 prolyl oligopeptidase family serine peptidase [Pseudoduganella dura]GGX92103.1 lipase [Pseudoduganella dura]
MLASCGGSSDGGDDAPPPAPPPPGRGTITAQAAVAPATLPDGSRVQTVTAAQLRALMSDEMEAVAGEPRCNVTTWTVRYRTAAPRDALTESTAAIMVPAGTDTNCTGARPVLVYAHGTTLDKRATMANLADTEVRLLAAMFAAQGYIVVAPNYQGYEGSTLDYHPYLDEQLQGADMVDALRAARTSFGAMGASPSTRLFVTGYSQGGHVALAAQKAMQALPGEFALTAVAGLSGPYAVIRFADSVVSGYPTQGITGFLPMVTTAGQRAGAGIYAAPGDMYEARYAPTIENLLPSAVPAEQLVAQGKLSATLFARDSMPQPQGPTPFFGDHPLVRTSYRNAYLADMAARPCAGEPQACAPENDLRKWAIRNDLRRYRPVAPLLLCGGDADPMVPFFNTTAASEYYAAQGSAPVLLDLDSDVTANDGWRSQRLGFAAAKRAVELDALMNDEDPDAAVAERYHGTLVAPFCLSAAREFFNARRP